MSAPPSKSAISGTPTNAEAKTAFAALWDYVVGRLGGDAAAPAPTAPEQAAARTALGATAVGAAVFTAADAAAARTALGVSTGLTLATAVASTSGTAIDFTGIPSWVTRITVMFNGVSTNGTSTLQCQIGTSGGVQTTAYVSNTATIPNGTPASTAVTTGFGLNANMGATVTMFGAFRLNLLNNATGIWVCDGVFARGDTVANYVFAGSKTLSGALDRIRITTVNGTDTFDAGSINILYEG
jgi:hypothetical protein